MSTAPFNAPVGAIEDETSKTTATTEPASPVATITHQRDIPNGTKVPITKDGKTVYGIKVGYLADVDKCLVKYGPHTERRKIHGFGAQAPRVKVGATGPEENGQTLAGAALYQGAVPERPAPVVVPPSRFTVARRFEFIAGFTDDVVLGDENALIVCGTGGLGKTFTVLERMALAGKIADTDVPAAKATDNRPPKKVSVKVRREAAVETGDDEEFPSAEEMIEAAINRDKKPEKKYDYTVIKGFSTPKSLYRALYDNKDKMVIFDDCDSVLDDEVAVNLLKAALDGYERRWIHWLSEKSFSSNEDDDDYLPPRFEFVGKVIFVSNRTLGQLDQAILSRCLHVDVTMNTQEKIDRIRELAPAMCKDMKMEAKLEVVEFMDGLKEQITDLNLRTFKKICGQRAKHPDAWKDRSEYLVTCDMSR